MNWKHDTKEQWFTNNDYAIKYSIISHIVFHFNNKIYLKNPKS